MAGTLAQAQRDLGADALSVCLPNGNLHYGVDRALHGQSRAARVAELLRFFAREGRSFDVFQFYFGESLAGPWLFDVPWLKRLGKQVHFYFCGCDVRDSKKAIATHEYSGCQECWPQRCSENRTDALKTATRHADGIWVSTPDLLDDVPGSVLLPQPIDLECITPVGEYRGGGPIRIAHAPSNRAIKGTRFVEAAVAELRRAGLPVELRLIENLPHADALRETAAADLVCDQMLIGAYGEYAVEAMALGKPVVCYLRPDLLACYPPDLPIVSATPPTLGAVLRQLIARRHEWPALGRRGIAYAHRMHDRLRVAQTMLDVYRSRRTRCAS
jgi:nucleotide-binding universal stress UspA family protein